MGSPRPVAAATTWERLRWSHEGQVRGGGDREVRRTRSRRGTAGPRQLRTRASLQRHPPAVRKSVAFWRIDTSRRRTGCAPRYSTSVGSRSETTGRAHGSGVRSLLAASVRACRPSDSQALALLPRRVGGGALPAVLHASGPQPAARGRPPGTTCRVAARIARQLRQIARHDWEQLPVVVCGRPVRRAARTRARGRGAGVEGEGHARSRRGGA